jgi:mRNA interferase MazF
MLPAFCGLTIPPVVLLEQLRTIDKSRLQAYIGTLDEITMMRISCALVAGVGIVHEE